MFISNVHKKSHSLATAESDNSPSAAVPLPPTNLRPTSSLVRPPQIRRKPTNRKKKYYWTNLTNIQHEIQSFWVDAGVVTNQTDSDACTIPNETLLGYYQRHDLRGAIAAYGGRDLLCQDWKEARRLPGRWKQAIIASPMLRRWMDQNPDLLSFDRPPPANPRRQKFYIESSSAAQQQRWEHTNNRRPKGFWSLQTVVTELYEYVKDYRDKHHRPMSYMPRPTELVASGRLDLAQAIQRYGGCKRIERTAGMISYREWYYFEGQLELLLLVRDYLKGYHNGDETYFPVATEIQRNNHAQLYTLIQRYGGRRLLAARFDMSTVRLGSGRRRRSHGDHDLYWGPFSLDFAIRLLDFVRNDQMQRFPPLKRLALAMPSANKLSKALGGTEGEWLANQVQMFGGYENVARRLGLAFFD